MNIINSALVGILSVLSLALQIIFLLNNDHPTDSVEWDIVKHAYAWSIVSAVALIMMFVLGPTHRMLGDIGFWLFAVTGVVSLSAQGIAYTATSSTDNVLLGFSVISTTGVSYFGHFMGMKKDEDDYDGLERNITAVRSYQIISFLKLVFSLAPFIIMVLINGYIEPCILGWYCTYFFVTSAYWAFAALPAFIPIKYQVIDTMLIEISIGYKKVKIVVSAVILVSLSIIYGTAIRLDGPNLYYSLCSLLFFVAAIVCDHINARYYAHTYKLMVQRKVGERRVARFM